MAPLKSSVNLNRTIDDYEVYLKKYLGNSPKVAVLLDYDGTITPIVEHVDLAIIPLATKAILKDLTNTPGIFVAVISGRNVYNVKEMVGVENITYAGNHGLEVLHFDGSQYIHQLPADINNQVKQLSDMLEENVVRDGAWLEHKGPSLTFHFRETPEHLRDEIEETAQQIIEEHNFKVGKAHCALEANPKVDWHKGKVAQLILEKEFGKKWPQKVKVIFAGDDATDEDAMEALKGNAATFRVTSDVNIKTYAEKLLSSPEAVADMLKVVLNLFKK